MRRNEAHRTDQGNLATNARHSAFRQGSHLRSRHPGRCLPAKRNVCSGRVAGKHSPFVNPQTGSQAYDSGYSGKAPGRLSAGNGSHSLRVISMSAMSSFIEAENLRKTYRVGKIEVQALRGVSFAVERGEFVSIVGPSGSGKSTLFYILGGLTRATSGRVTIDGEDFARLSDAQRTEMRKKKIGFVFQKFNLLPTLTAKGNIEIAREIAGKNGLDKPLFERVTQMLGIAGRLDHR